MMKVGYLLIFSILLLSGCDNSDQTQDYSQFLADEEGKYSVYVVAEEENQVPVEVMHENHDISRIVNMDSLEQQQVPQTINEMPYYMVFDSEDKIYETNNKEEFLDFVKELEK